MENLNLGPEHFFPGMPWYEKRDLESQTNWLLLPDGTKRGRPWQAQDANVLLAEEVTDFDYQKANYPPHDILQQLLPHPIEKAKPFDIISLLSLNHGGTGNYLVRSTSTNGDSEDPVDVETLRGKFIMLCCFSAPVHRTGSPVVSLQPISLASHELSHKYKENFAMVVVPKMKDHWAHDKAAFDHFVSAFSCLVVPFNHALRRDYICKCLNFEGLNKGLLVDPNNIVVQDSVSFLTWCVVDAFPFTDDILHLYRTKILRGKSLEELLGLTPSDYVEKHCSTPGGAERPEKVSVSVLKEKLVGLYLCVTGKYIPKLEKAYQQCQDREHGFEIVLVYMPFCADAPPDVFQEVFNRVFEKRKISWWVLPYSYSVSFRLCRLFNCISDQLIIVSPGGELVDPCGGLVIEYFGITAYPFTREGLVKAAFEKLEQLSLESLLEGGSLRKNDGHETCVADLQGRNVLLYLGYGEISSLYKLLTEFYDEIKAKDPDFEVVFVCLRDLDNQNLPSMPWLVFHPNVSNSKTLFRELYLSSFVGEKLVAFDKDGQICSIDAQHLLTSPRPRGAFPLSGDLLGEIVSELDSCCGSQFRFNMAWSQSFMMDKRMTTSRKRAKRFSSLDASDKIRQTRAIKEGCH